MMRNILNGLLEGAALVLGGAAAFALICIIASHFGVVEANLWFASDLYGEQPPDTEAPE